MQFDSDKLYTKISYARFLALNNYKTYNKNISATTDFVSTVSRFQIEEGCIATTGPFLQTSSIVLRNIQHYKSQQKTKHGIYYYDVRTN
jgi:hypothetical protein